MLTTPLPQRKRTGGGGGGGEADPPEAKMPVPVHTNTPPLGHDEHLPRSQPNGNHDSLKLKISPKPAGCSQWTGSIHITSPKPKTSMISLKKSLQEASSLLSFSCK